MYKIHILLSLGLYKVQVTKVKIVKARREQDSNFFSEQQTREIAQFSQERNVTRNVGVLFPLLRTESSECFLDPHPEKGSEPFHSCTDYLLHSTR